VLGALSPDVGVRLTELEVCGCAVGILVDLLTLDVQSYGEESLAGSKVVEHITSAPAALSVTSSNVPVPQPVAAAAVATTGTAVMGPPVRPRPPLPVPSVVTSNTFIQPSEHLFCYLLCRTV